MPKRKNEKHSAMIFSALGDETRLGLVRRLASGGRYSISELSQESQHTRQAVTKHLRVLEGAGLARSTQEGRQVFYEMNAAALDEATQFLDQVSRQWDAALARLKDFVEQSD